MGLRESLDESVISEMNCRPSVVVARTATVREAVVSMRAAGLGCVIVVDDDQRAVGMFTEGMLRHRLNETPRVLDDPVEIQMVERFAWALPTDPVGTVLDAMDVHNTRFIAVLDSEKHPIGITGQKTLIEFIAGFYPHLVLTEDPTGITTSLRKEGA